MPAFDDFVRAVEQATGRPGRRIGKNTRLLCPAHDDHHPSLDVTEADDGSPLVTCRTCGAHLPEVCAAIGRNITDFLPSRNGGQPDDTWTPHGPAIATYPYLDENRVLLFEVCRTADKQFPQRRPDPSSPSGWRWKLEGVRRVLYRLPDILNASDFGEPIYIAEGEKDVHALVKNGVDATCNPGGAGKWRDDYCPSLTGAAEIIIIADNDQPGLDHAHTIAASLRRTLGADCPTVRIVKPKTGKDAADHFAAGHQVEDLVELTALETPKLALRLRDFLDLDLKPQPALLGTEDDAIIPMGGLVILAGMPGAGKTTLVIDFAFHLASGRDWLGIPTPRPANLLFVENEGPQHKFQNKLRRKAELWQHETGGDIHVHVWRWGSFSFGDQDALAMMLDYLDEHDIHVIVGDPLDTLGAQGVGSPEDTRAFVSLLPPLGLTKNRSFLFLHHFRKEVSVSEINQVSGAWGGRLDSLLVLKETEQPDELRLSFPKLRWADQRQPLILGKIKNTASFEVLAEEQPPTDDTQVEAMLRRIIDTLGKTGGVMERPALAMRCESTPGDRTFQRALRVGLDRDLLAKEQKGRKASYSLTEASWYQG